MGIEYALVDDGSGEAFELGKGPWGEWERGKIPTSLTSILGLMEEWREDHDLDLVYTTELADRIWRFIEAHPSCKLVNDCAGDYYWTEHEAELVEAQADAGAFGSWDGIYKTIGSRYAKPDFDALALRARAEGGR